MAGRTSNNNNTGNTS